MDKIRVIQMGVGTIGSVVTRSLVRKKGVEIVGALDTDERKTGRDLGDVADVGRCLGVRVTDDADTLFSETYADVVLHTSCSLIQEAYPQITRPIQEGLDIISACEDLGNPYGIDPALAARLEKLARENGVTVLGSGLSPGFTSDYLILALTAVCSRVDRIRYIRASDVRCYLGGVVGRHFGLGLSLEEFRRGVEQGQILGHTGFTPSVGLIADRLGWDLDEIRQDLEPTYDAEGRFASTRTVVKGIKDGRAKIEMELQAFVTVGAEVFDRITIEGVPPIDVTIRPYLESTEATANATVNAIPHVINAPPGLMTPADLPLVFALEDDMRLLLNRA